ncbi:MAG: arginine N-succinyltransferase [Myxococcota bacterium]
MSTSRHNPRSESSPTLHSAAGFPGPASGSAPAPARDRSSETPRGARKRIAGFTGLQVLGAVAVAMLLTAGVTYWVVRTYIWPADFEPVALSQVEQVELDGKLRALGIDPPAPAQKESTGAVSSRGPSTPSDASNASGPRPSAEAQETAEEWLRAERYSEDPSKREIGLNERELNALLAHNTDLAKKLAVDLSDDLASARLLIPVDPDFPVLGGRTLRVAAGLELKYGDGRPVVIVRGVSLMGVPIPNAWLGNLKNVDLVEQFGGGPGIWKAFSDGVEFVEIREGELKIKLKP